MDNLDIYASIPGLNFRGKTKHSTWFTLIASLVLYLAILGLFTYLSLELFNREEPNVANSFYSDPNPQKVDLSSSTDLFAVQLSAGGSIPIVDESIFKVEVELITKSFSDTIQDQVKQVQAIPCEEYVKSTKIPENVDPKSLSKFYCFDTNNLYLKGDWGHTGATFLVIRFRKCQGPSCKSRQEIDSLTDRAYMTINYTNINFFPNDYSNPTPKYLAHHFTTTKPDSVKGVNIYYSPMTVESNIGLVMNDASTSTTLMLDRVFESDSARIDNETIGQYIIRLSTKQVKYTRVYLKLQKVLAEVGGLMNGLRLIGAGLSYFYSKKLKFFLVANQIAEKPLQYKESSSNNVSSAHLEDKQGTRNNTKLSFSALSFIPGTRSSKQTNDFMKKHASKVDRILDLRNLIKVLKEVELMKAMLLSPQQNALLSFFDNYFVVNKFTELGYKKQNDLEQLNSKDRAELEGYLASLNSSRNKDDQVLLNALFHTTTEQIAFIKN